MRAARFLLALVAVPALGAPAATLAQLEREAVRLAGERDRAVAERGRLAGEAAPLAERIAAAGGSGSSAGRELTRRLRELDRVAAQLDAVERRQRELERRLARALSEFERQAQAEERRLLDRGPGEGARSALAGIAGARRRLAALAQPARFRPPLEVSLAPLDGSAEIEAKLQIVGEERARLAARERELRGEQALLAARLRGTREWAGELGAVRRDAGGEVELLERAHESAESAVRELSARDSAVTQELAQLRRWDEALALRSRELEQALRSLAARRGQP